MPGIAGGGVGGNCGPIYQIGGGLNYVALIGLAIEPEIEGVTGTHASRSQVRGSRQNKQSNTLGWDRVAEDGPVEGDISQAGNGIGGSKLPNLSEAAIWRIGKRHVWRSRLRLFVY